MKQILLDPILRQEFGVALVWLWVAGQPALAALPLVLMGTGLGFGVNRLVFGVVRPVPELRREREQAQSEA